MTTGPSKDQAERAWQQHRMKRARLFIMFGKPKATSGDEREAAPDDKQEKDRA